MYPHDPQEPDEPIDKLVLPASRFKPRREVDSDVHPQRHEGEPPLPSESDNIPGDQHNATLTMSTGRRWI